MSFLRMKIIFVICTLAFSFDIAFGKKLGKESVELAQKWAPKIYLSSKEDFWPGDVEVFLKHVSPQGEDCQSSKKLPTGSESQKCYLTTRENPNDLLENKNSYLYGTTPTSLHPVPAYVHVKKCGDHVVLSYWIFFPYNKGKDACRLVSYRMGCGGDQSTKSMVGNHVGDWEHLSVKLKNGKPVSMFLSVHDGGVFYNYEKASKSFVVSSQLHDGILNIPDPPSTIHLADTHPILYCAAGSHAVWGAAGTFSYSRVELKVLVDVTDQGPEWRTWESLKVFYSKETTPDWWYYDGRWGNKRSQCMLGMYCVVANGPKGLSTRPDEYECE